MELRPIWIMLACLAGLAACGETAGEQALYGGAAGVVAAAVTEGDIATGAAVGAAGNLVYCQTYPDKCN